MIAKQCLAQAEAMQIATLRGGSPQVNSVYFVAADDMKTLYWMSEPRRRHSENLAIDSRMAGAIAARTDKPVAGLQFTGSGSVVEDQDELRAVISRYNEKYHDIAAGLYERIQSGTNKHRIYKLELASMELFDEVHFPGGDIVSVPLI